MELLLIISIGIVLFLFYDFLFQWMRHCYYQELMRDLREFPPPPERSDENLFEKRADMWLSHFEEMQEQANEMITRGLPPEWGESITYNKGDCCSIDKEEYKSNIGSNLNHYPPDGETVVSGKEYIKIWDRKSQLDHHKEASAIAVDENRRMSAEAEECYQILQMVAKEWDNRGKFLYGYGAPACIFKVKEKLKTRQALAGEGEGEVICHYHAQDAKEPGS